MHEPQFFERPDKAEQESVDFQDDSRGAPAKWPFLDMHEGQVITITDSHKFTCARSAIVYAKRVKGYKIKTKLVNGKLFVKRMP